MVKIILLATESSPHLHVLHDSNSSPTYIDSQLIGFNEFETLTSIEQRWITKLFLEEYCGHKNNHCSADQQQQSNISEQEQRNNKYELCLR
jgi:hypothetical protein